MVKVLLFFTNWYFLQGILLLHMGIKFGNNLKLKVTNYSSFFCCNNLISENRTVRYNFTYVHTVIH